jgi:hypothetical protein
MYITVLKRSQLFLTHIDEKNAMMTTNESMAKSHEQRIAVLVAPT